MIEVSGPADTDANLALIDKDDYKTFVKTVATTSDDMLDMIIPALCREFFDETGRHFIKDVSAHTWLLDGTNRRVLKLPHWPITSVTSVEVGYLSSADIANDFVTTATLTATGESDAYMVKAAHGELIRFKDIWSTGTETIKVVWEAGYETVPADLVRAMCEWTGVVLKKAASANWNLRAQTKGSESKVLDPDDRPPAIQAQIRKYSKTGFGIG
jgi:hypothetical protein